MFLFYPFYKIMLHESINQLIIQQRPCKYALMCIFEVNIYKLNKTCF